MRTYDPRIGDYGCVKTHGFFGWLIRLGTFSRWNHSVIYVGNGEVVSADPTGVKINKVTDYDHVAWNQHEELDDAQRLSIVDYARAAVGAPYSFFTIFDIALRILGLKIIANTRFAKWLSQREGYICSELVSECYNKSGLALAKEDWICTPGDLAERLIWQ